MESLIAAVSVYARKYGLSRLSEESGISRSQLHRVLNGKNTSLETIGRILEVLGLSLTIKKTREDLTLSLANKEALKFALAVHGAPLLVDRERELEFKGQKIPSKNKTLIAALQKGREDSAINAVLPIFIHKNWNEIDLGELMMAEVDPRYLAYQLDLLYRLTNSLDYLDAMTNVRPKEDHFKAGSDTGSATKQNAGTNFFTYRKRGRPGLGL